MEHHLVRIVIMKIDRLISLSVKENRILLSFQSTEWQY